MNIQISQLSPQQIAERGITKWPVWSCDISEFPWEYDTGESCLLIEGEAEISTDSGTVTIRKGDFVVFPRGLRCHWKVLKPVKKYYSFT